MKIIKLLSAQMFILVCMFFCSCEGNSEAKKNFEREEYALKFINEQITGVNKLIEECKQIGDYKTEKSLQLHKENLIKQHHEQLKRRNAAYKEYYKE